MPDCGEIRMSTRLFRARCTARASALTKPTKRAPHFTLHAPHLTRKAASSAWPTSQAAEPRGAATTPRGCACWCAPAPRAAPRRETAPPPPRAPRSNARDRVPTPSPPRADRPRRARTPSAPHLANAVSRPPAHAGSRGSFVRFGSGSWRRSKTEHAEPAKRERHLAPRQDLLRFRRRTC